MKSNIEKIKINNLNYEIILSQKGYYRARFTNHGMISGVVLADGTKHFQTSDDAIDAATEHSKKFN